MKRLIAAGAIAALLFSLLTGCAERGGQSSVPSSSEGVSAPESSQSELSAPESSEPESSEGVSTAAVRRELFQFQNNGKNYTVAYPVFLGMKHSEGLNAAVKAAAMSDVEKNGYTEEKDASGKQTVQVTVRTDYELTRQSGDFVSVLFTVSFGRSDAAHPSKYTRSINFDLKSGKALAVSELLKDDEDLYEVIWEAVRDNAPAEIVGALPSETIAQNKAETSVYMTPDGIGFSLPVPYVLGDVYQIVVPYFEMKPFLKVDANPEENALYQAKETETASLVSPQ
ncbi:hypothetical protein [Faecalispora anaeroviscerum]|uniref:hypothetical protein n=1 Tax=Faecalispora anaeroviscerum TaxID=2991836 RepID=UPI0024BAA9E2|nr:hypothetical protein [Faecalispora anaeroviscerum]